METGLPDSPIREVNRPMSPIEIRDRASFMPYSEELKSKRAAIAALRELARSDQESAKLVEADRQYFDSIQQLLATTNAAFEALSRAHAALRHAWYVENAPYHAADAASIIEAHRSWLIDTDEAPVGIEYYEGLGRALAGAGLYRVNILIAQSVLEEEAIRAQARRMMPSRAKLKALAEAHLRSIGG